MGIFVVVHFIIACLVDERDVALVAIGLSKAFDSICPNVITSKIESLRRPRLWHTTDSVISIRPP